ncbi:MAG: amylo-alpha-1,6-glucosidase [Planctomycetota bacterium]
MPSPHLHTLSHQPPRNTPDLLAREWLLTNGRGGFAMGTALGANTRRYHGLLIAAVSPPVGRVVVLHNVFEQLLLHQGGATQTLEFNTNLFRASDGLAYVPDSPAMLVRFDRGLDVIWSYQWGGLTFTRQLVLHDGAPAATLHYDLHGLDAVCQSATLRLSPMVSLRGFHDLVRRDDAAYHHQPADDSLRLTRHGVTATYHAPGSGYDHAPDWWYNLHYPVEAHRGAGDREDLLLPGGFVIDLGSRSDATASLTATLGDSAARPQNDTPSRADRIEPQRVFLADQLSQADAADRLAPILAQAADDFVVQRYAGGQTLSTIIAGYPWFADWGRDTFIALPGLMLCTGRTEQARATLQAFASAIKDGLVPNRFDDDDPTLAHYNTIDAGIWFLHAALAYVDQTDDQAAWNGWMAQACVQIVDHYAAGTSATGHDGRAIEIRMDGDGLITGGDDHSQLTWMDAACPDAQGQVHVFTPRPGKCVEINGLWYSALARLSQRLDQSFRDRATRYAELAKQVKQGFTLTFWDEQLGYYIDHVAPANAQRPGPDRSLRPNQYIACALEHSPVEDEHRQKAVAIGIEKLLTPVGPRTLPMDDPAFFGRYEGDRYLRDRTYHQGMAWPWLIGPLGESVLRAGGFSVKARQQVRQMLEPLVDRLLSTDHPGCLGQLHEIYEPIEPFTPRGAPGQAWSVAETLRLLTLIHGKR